MKPSTSFGVALLLATTAAYAGWTTGSGTAATENRTVSGFSALSVGGNIDVVVRQGGKEALELRADDNVLPLIETVVEGSGDDKRLVIRFKRGESVRTKTQVLATVDVVNLKALALSGSGDALVEALNTPAFALSLSGSSDAVLKKIDTPQLKVSISGSGDVKAAGAAGRCEFSIAGSGDVASRDLACDDVSISIAGSGDAKVSAKKTLAVSIAGSGDVEYSGGAQLVKSSVAGSGSVRQKQ
jgi:Putative auto-transporter adhesin, head GIN domain